MLGGSGCSSRSVPENRDGRPPVHPSMRHMRLYAFAVVIAAVVVLVAAGCGGSGY